MIRAAITSTFWLLCLVFGAIVAFPVTYATGKIDFLWRVAILAARAGVRVAGLRVTVIGREQLDPAQTYLFMANHVSNIDPPLLVPLLGRRISALGKKELFALPLFGTALRIAQFVPVDRSHRESAIESVREAASVLKGGLSMLVYPEGTRSHDGKLLPFKKGAFYLAQTAGVPIVPITMVGVHEAWPKGKFEINPGPVKIVFHQPIDTSSYSSREELMAAVRAAIESGFQAG
jgi:1-acyl-sn-glycerol-3-phosphate acyltransferase